MRAYSLRDRQFSTLVLALAMLLSFSACNRHRQAVQFTGDTDPVRISAALNEHLLEADWYAAKIHTDVRVNGQKKSFKTNLRMRTDSAIWLSISPALGIEVARLIISPDSVKFIDKLGDRYYIGDHSFLEQQSQIEVDFSMLQDLVLGNPIYYAPQEEYSASTDSAGYILTSFTSSQVRRTVGIRNDGRHAFDPTDTLGMNVDEKKLERLLAKVDDKDELLVRQYWVHPESYKLVGMVITDLLKLRSIEAAYQEFEEIESQKVPTKCTYRFSDNRQSVDFKMTYARVKLNQKTTFPFKIPEKFVEIE